ncbi:MAG: GNAT family N-acetyltransferase [Coriobacteriia bacterium]
MRVVDLDESHRGWASRVVREHFDSAMVVSRGVLHDTDSLPGLVALSDGAPVGLLRYRLGSDGCEVVVLIAARPGQGVGTALIEAVGRLAAEARCRRLWLITTNDNVPAQRFYLSRGWTLSAVYPGAIQHSRLLKPEIPLTGLDGIAVEDELEFELLLRRV